MGRDISLFPIMFVRQSCKIVNYQKWCVAAQHVFEGKREGGRAITHHHDRIERVCVCVCVGVCVTQREGGRETERGAMCFLSTRHSPPRDPAGWRSCLLLHSDKLK